MGRGHRCIDSILGLFPNKGSCGDIWKERSLDAKLGIYRGRFKDCIQCD